MSSKKRSQSSKRTPVDWAKQILMDFPKAAFCNLVKPEPTNPFHTSNTLFDKNTQFQTVTSSIQFKDVKEIRQSCPPGTTINDIILTAFCGALDRYAKKHGEDLAGKLMRAFCAVSMPDAPGRAKEDMYNDFVMPSFDLPVGIPSSAKRLEKARETMGKLKVSLVGPITTCLSHVLGRLGLDAVAGDTQLDTFPKHSFVYSNVPGFEQPVYLFSNASKITGFQVYYPNVISQVIFLSYCDKMTMSLCTSPDVVKEADFLVKAFVDEIEAWKTELAK